MQTAHFQAHSLLKAKGISLDLLLLSFRFWTHIAVTRNLIHSWKQIMSHCCKCHSIHQLSVFGICNGICLPLLGVKMQSRCSPEIVSRTDVITLLKKECGIFSWVLKLVLIFKYSASKCVCSSKTCNWFVVKMVNFFNECFSFHLKMIIAPNDGHRLQTENV